MTSISNTIKKIVNSRRTTKRRDLEYFNSLKTNIPTDRAKLSEKIKDKKGISVISEIKPKSPTLGRIRTKMDVKSVVSEMESAGVIGLSILTEPNYFGGSYKNLQCAVENTQLPCLMKDFVIDELQLKIAKRIGATNVLLINSVIDISKFYPLCLKYDLEPLIEIHDRDEIKDIKHLIEEGYNPKIIGVNNRNLRTLKVDLRNSLKIIPELREEVGIDQLIISESGIKTHKDIQSINSTGADAFLIGSSIMKSQNIGRKILELRGIK